jgi:hypothetical protein
MGTCSFQCSGGLQSCGGECIDPKTDVDNCNGCGKACPEVDGGTPACQGGKCLAMCDSGLSLCGGACVDTRSDPANCSKCGKKCPGNRSCVLGICLP